MNKKIPSCFGEICIYAPEFPYNPLFKNFYLSHHHDCNATSAAARCIAPKLFSSDRAQVVPRLGSALYDTMAPDPAKVRFAQEIWKHVESKVASLKNKTPGGQTPTQWEKTCVQVKSHINKEAEARNIPFNLAHLSDPGQAAIPEDLLEISKVEKSGKYYFWDSNAKCPKAPQVWPRGRNIPIAIYSDDITKQSPFQHFGHCSVVAGFFWSWAQAIQNPEWKSTLPKFEALCINALADYTLVRNQQDVNILAFNAVEANEESRENDGFTGARKALLIEYAVKNVSKANPGKKLKYEDVAAWLKSNIKFHDEKQVPSPNTCRDLHAVSSLFLKNKRAFAAYQEAETLWGRATLFDEYSKMVILTQKCRNPKDLAFIAEWLLADMKANCKSPSAVPDKVSQGRLKEIGGPICVAQATMDAVQWLITTDMPPTWALHSDLLQELAQPSRFRELFPPGSQTPETTVKRLAACPRSIKELAKILKLVHESSPDWAEKLKGTINGARLWTIPTEKFKQMFQVFAEDWTLFQETCCEESGKPKPVKEGERKDVLPEDEKDAGKTAPAHREEDTQNERQEVLEQARQKARSVYTMPGVVILRPERWDRAALTSLMKNQLTFEDLGTFTGFYFVDSDRLARVHPSQNTCLRHAPVCRARLLDFCQAMDAVMMPNRDTVVIGVGRADGNAQTILELVGELGWSHKPIDVISTRETYDTFIKSGSPLKKRRLHRGLATIKYVQKFLVCWKGSRDSTIRTLSIKSGLRHYVDKGSSIASDCMMECPVVQLSDIFAVTAEMQQKAFGVGGMETPDEAAKAPDVKDFTTSHLSKLM